MCYPSLLVLRLGEMPCSQGCLFCDAKFIFCRLLPPFQQPGGSLSCRWLRLSGSGFVTKSLCRRHPAQRAGCEPSLQAPLLAGVTLLAAVGWGGLLTRVRICSLRLYFSKTPSMCSGCIQASRRVPPHTHGVSLSEKQPGVQKTSRGSDKPCSPRRAACRQSLLLPVPAMARHVAEGSRLQQAACLIFTGYSKSGSSRNSLLGLFF